MELNGTVSNQDITIHQLDIEAEELKNRSLQETLAFRNIKKQQIWEYMGWHKNDAVNEISENI